MGARGLVVVLSCVAACNATTGGTDGGGFVAAAGDCSLLPAVGTWENVSPLSGKTATFSQNFSEAIIVDPFDPSTVWLTIGYGGIFKSTNCGALGSWVHVNTGRNGAAMDKGSHVIPGR